MNERIVLAFCGDPSSTAAIPWLVEHHEADVVAVTVDLGQDGDLDQIRARALAAGAVRAHVIDARETFARDHVVAALRESAAGEMPAIDALPRVAIARALLDIAEIEGTRVVAHGSAADAMDGAIASLGAGVRIVAPAREWRRAGVELATYARRHGLSPSLSSDTLRARGNVVHRPAVDRPAAADTPAHVDLSFEAGVPVAINGVTMSTAELIDSLSLIAGRHAIGRIGDMEAPAAVVFRNFLRDTARSPEGSMFPPV